MVIFTITIFISNLFRPAAFSDSETTEILEQFVKSFKTKKQPIGFYRYFFLINQLDMLMLKKKWNKELEVPIYG